MNNFPKHSGVAIDGVYHEIERQFDGRPLFRNPADGSVFAAPDAFGVVRPISETQFEQMLLEGAKIVRKASHDRGRHMNDVAQ